MKFMKKSVSVFLAILMVLGSVSLLATAADSGYKYNWEIDTKFYKMKRNADGFIVDADGNVVGDENDTLPVDENGKYTFTPAWEDTPTNAAAKGEPVIARVFLTTDFAMGASGFLFRYSKNFLTHNTANYEDGQTEVGFKPITNTDPASAVYANGFNGNITTGTESGGQFALMVEYGYLDESQLADGGWIFAQMNTGNYAFQFDGKEWFLEFHFTVNKTIGNNTDGSLAEGQLHLWPEAVANYETNYDASTSISAQPKGTTGSFNKGLQPVTDYDMFAYTLHDDDADSNLTTVQSTLTFNANGGTFADGTTANKTLTADIAPTKAATGIPADPTMTGYNFLGWVPSTVANPTEADVVETIKVGYADVTYNALYESADATYVLNTYTMDVNGDYQLVTTKPGATVDDEITYDQTKIPAGFALDTEAANVLSTTVTADDTDVITVYLKRNKYSVAFGEDSTDMFYEATYKAPAGPAKDGYTFAGWETTDAEGNKTVLQKDETGTVGIGGVAYTATYAPAANKVTIVINYIDQVTGEAATATKEVPSTTENTVAIVDEIPAEPAANTDYVLISDLNKIEHYEYTATGSETSVTVAADGKAVINVNYVPKKYTATFGDTATYTEDYYTSITAPALPAKDGQTPLGWTTDGKTVAIEAGKAFNISSDVEYTALYEATDYTVTYVYSGAAPAGIAVPPADTANMDEVVTFPTPDAVYGWTFNGWTVDGAAADSVTIATSDVTVTGTWTKNTYTVNYWLDSAKTKIHYTEDFYFNDAVTKPADPTKNDFVAAGINGVTFTDWEQDVITVIDEDVIDSGFFKPVAGETGKYVYDLVPITSEIEYTASITLYDENDEILAEDVIPGLYYGNELTADDLADYEAIEGYTFKEWKYNGKVLTAESYPIVIEDNIKLYGYFTVNQYPVIFDADGGKWSDGDTQKTVMVNYGAMIEAPAELPARDGYTLDAVMPWDPELSEMYPELEWNEELGEWVTSEDYEVPVIYAVWVADEYTITFDVEGTKTASTYTYNDSKTIGEVAEITVPAASKAGYDFKGWSTDGSTENIVADINAEALPVGDTTYYAVFAPSEGGVDYTVNRYFMDTEGNYNEEKPDVITLHEKAGTEVTYNVAVTGFTLDTEHEDSVLTAVIAGDGSTVLNAYYSRNKITVDVNGTVDDYYYEEVIDIPDAPEKEGETFEKWVDEDGNTVPDPFEVPAEEDGKITITPVYKKNIYKATFYISAEGSSIEYTTTEAEYESDVVVPAEPTEANLPTGYTFVGWAKTEGATEALDDLGAMPADDVTFYAVLEGKSGISYNIEKYFMETDGATYTLDASKSETKTDGVAGETKTITADTYEGFTFDEDNAENVLTAMIKGNGTTTFKVYYNRNTVKVTIGDDEPVDKYYGEEIQKPADVPEEEIPEGKKQDGWVDGNGDPVEFPVKVGTDPIVIKPNFVADEFLITFVNGETTVQSGNQTYGEVIVVPTDPVLAGHSFDGWYDANNNKIVAGTTTVPSAATTYTAKFTPINYTVNFVADGETVKTGSFAFGTVISTIVPEYTAPAGYEFKGWSTDGVTVIEDLSKETVPVDGITYFAVNVTTDGTAYTIETYVQNTSGTGYAKSSETKYGVTGTEINYEPAAKTGFTLNSEKSDLSTTITADDTDVIKVVYDRNKVSVTINGVEEEKYFDEVIDEVEEPTPEEGYEFKGWKDEDGNTVTFPMNVPAEDIVIVPVYTPIKNAVTFKVDGEDYATGKYDYKSDIKAPEDDPAKAGYTFKGWAKDGKTVLTDLGTVAIGDNNNIFYAVFEANEGINYTVNKVFQSNDGQSWLDAVPETRTGTAGELITIDADAEAVSGFSIYNIDPASAEIAGNGSTVFYIYYTRNKISVTINGEKDDYYYDTEIKEPEEPAKDGYDFKGWVDEDGNTVTFPIKVPAEDIVITPVYEAQTKSLSFEIDGATVEGYPTTAKVDSAISAPADPEKEGYSFVGWYIKGTNTAFNGKMPAADTVYEAKWTAGSNTKYTIEIYMMDTEGKYSMQTSTISFGVTGTLAEIVPNNEALVGFTHDAALSELSKLIEADGSTVLKIYYARDLYTVTWDVDGVETEDKVYYGAAIVAPADPVKDGYTFAGWDPEVPATMPANDVEYTATWAEASYTVTYVVDGTKTTETYKYGDTVTVKAAPSVEGMTFDGWFDGETEYAAGSTFTMPAKDLIIVADFSVGIYKVTYLDATGAVFTTEMVRFGDEIPVPADAPTKDHYEFKGWNITYDSMPAEDIVVEPIFERVPVKLIPEAGSTTVIDRDNFLIYGLQEYLNESILDKYLAVEGDGYYTIVPVSAGYYGTGAKVELYDNLDTSAPIETYTIIVFGDINGDSLAQAIDSAYADDEQLMKTDWSEEQIFNGTEWVANPNYDPYKTMAADLNGDGIIDSIDATIIGDSSIGIVRINQVTGRTA